MTAGDLLSLMKFSNRLIMKNSEKNKHLQKDFSFRWCFRSIILSIHLAKLPLCLIQNNLIHFLSQYILLHNSLHIPFVSNPQNQKILHSQDDENYVFRCHGKDFRECFEQFEKATIFDGMTIYDAESEIEVLFG